MMFFKIHGSTQPYQDHQIIESVRIYKTFPRHAAIHLTHDFPKASIISGVLEKNKI